MELLVVGSVAFDSIKTPFGEKDKSIGGSATYFSVSASYFSPVSVVAVIGEDFPSDVLDFMKGRSINVDGIQRVKGNTFYWKGEYGYDLNTAITHDTQLNVFADFNPTLPDKLRDSKYLFLANIDPEIQMEVLNQVKAPRLIACDTMNFWIEGKPDALKKTISKVDILLINEAEARELGSNANLIKAAKDIMAMGPKTLVIKRGEYGSLMFSGNTVFSAPAYPLEVIFDPTGAGDTFAGGFMGHIAKSDNISEASLRKAIILGSTMASFNVEDFSFTRIKELQNSEINERYTEFKRLTHFEDIV